MVGLIFLSRGIRKVSALRFPASRSVDDRLPKLRETEYKANYNRFLQSPVLPDVATEFAISPAAGLGLPHDDWPIAAPFTHYMPTCACLDRDPRG